MGEGPSGVATCGHDKAKSGIGLASAVLTTVRPLAVTPTAILTLQDRGLPARRLIYTGIAQGRRRSGLSELGPVGPAGSGTSGPQGLGALPRCPIVICQRAVRRPSFPSRNDRGGNPGRRRGSSGAQVRDSCLPRIRGIDPVIPRQTGRRRGGRAWSEVAAQDLTEGSTEGTGRSSWQRPFRIRGGCPHVGLIPVSSQPGQRER